MFDIIIVGAGVAGSRTAELIAKEGKEVLLIEKKSEIGKLSKCTGLVSWRIFELLSKFPKEIVVNIFGKAKFFSPNGNYFILKSKNPVYLLNRQAFDKFLFESVTKSGAEIHLSEAFESFKYLKDCVKVKTDKKIYKSKLLIGADGANSIVGRQAGFNYPKNFLIGMQTTANGNFDSVELWFGSKICPNFFAWVVPENGESARVGLATNPNPDKFYENFLMKRIGRVEEPNTSGIIKFGFMKETTADRVIVVGDAACQIKAHSGGGIIYSLIASKICADAAIKSLEEKRFDNEFLKENYDKKWKEKLEKPIRRSLFLHKILSSSDATLNFLFSLVKISTKIFNNLDMDLINFFT